MKLYAIITAAGSSSRMGLDIPKPLLPLAGKPVLLWAVEAFEQLAFEQITITCPAAQQAAFEEVVARYDNCVVIPGGATRAHSIYLALQLLPDNGLVLVHDGARPLVSPDLIRRVIDGARCQGAAIPGLPLVDTIKQVTHTKIVTATPPRHQYMRVQTPQGFTIPLLKNSYERALAQLDDAQAITDDSSLVERLGGEVMVVDGEESNIKITKPFDLQLAELIIKSGKQAG